MQLDKNIEKWEIGKLLYLSRYSKKLIKSKKKCFHKEFKKMQKTMLYFF